MKRTISLLFLILISCGKPTKEKSEKTSIKSNLPDTIVIHKTKEWYTDLIENSQFYEAVTKSTSNKLKVLERFRIAKEILDKKTYD